MIQVFLSQDNVDSLVLMLVVRVSRSGLEQHIERENLLAILVVQLIVVLYQKC